MSGHRFDLQARIELSVSAPARKGARSRSGGGAVLDPEDAAKEFKNALKGYRFGPRGKYRVEDVVVSSAHLGIDGINELIQRALRDKRR